MIKTSKNNRKLLFLEPITKDMSVDTILTTW